jgi:hypothetical protein
LHLSQPSLHISIPVLNDGSPSTGSLSATASSTNTSPSKEKQLLRQQQRSTCSPDRRDGGNHNELVSPSGTKLSDVVVSADDTSLERYPISYLNPVFSKPLPRPWLPLAIASYWELLPKYSSDGEVDDEEDEDDAIDNDAFNSQIDHKEPEWCEEAATRSAASDPFSNAHAVPGLPNPWINGLECKVTDSPQAAVTTDYIKTVKIDGGSESSSVSKPIPRVVERVRKNTTRSARSGSLSKGVIVVATRDELHDQENVVGADLTITPDGRLEVWNEAPEKMGDV